MVDGGTIPHLGQKQLSVADNVMGSDVQSIFQIAAVTRPLMSVGKICDEGHNITFDKSAPWSGARTTKIFAGSTGSRREDYALRSLD